MKLIYYFTLYSLLKLCKNLGLKTLGEPVRLVCTLLKPFLFQPGQTYLAVYFTVNVYYSKHVQDIKPSEASTCMNALAYLVTLTGAT